MTKQRIIGGALIALLLAAAAYAVTELTTAQEAEQDFDSISRSSLSGRTFLSLCVDDGAGGVSDEAVDVVREALEAVLTAEADLPGEYERREVTGGCPAPAAALGTPISEYDIHGRPVEDPSVHAVFVYLIDPSLYTATFGDDPYAMGTEEIACDYDNCIAVTRSLYIPASVSVELLQTGLADVIGLIQHENREPELDWSACERGEQPHPAYDCSTYEDWLEDRGE